MVKQAIFCAESKIAYVGDTIMVNYKNGKTTYGAITFIPEDLGFFVISTTGGELRVDWADVDAVFKTILTDVSDDKLVSHPDHYQSEDGLETITVIEAFTKNLTGIEATDTGNVLKYMCRWKKKNGLQDLKKAKWYLEHLINHVEKETK